MNSMQFWTTFFGWMTVVNLGIYLISVIALASMRGFAYRINAKIFGISEDDIATISVQYVAAYKVLIAAFFFAPWLALKLMA